MNRRDLCRCARPIGSQKTIAVGNRVRPAPATRSVSLSESSRPSARRTLVALGLRDIPAPISRKFPACSKTFVSKPVRASERRGQATYTAAHQCDAQSPVHRGVRRQFTRMSASWIIAPQRACSRAIRPRNSSGVVLRAVMPNASKRRRTFWLASADNAARLSRATSCAGVRDGATRPTHGSDSAARYPAARCLH